MPVSTVSHPLAQAMLTQLRDVNATAYQFRDLLDRLTAMLMTEATRAFVTHPVQVDTPVGPANGVALDRTPVLAPVLRAGLGMLPAAQRLLPDAPVAFVGVSRDEETREPSPYLSVLPDEVEGGDVMLLEPMIATGGSVLHAIDVVQGAGAATVTVCCVLAAPEGLARLQAAHPEVAVWAAAVDERLDDRAFIVPGLGDAGDRQFGVPRR